MTKKKSGKRLILTIAAVLILPRSMPPAVRESDQK
jgi:hypothetical protein